MHSSVSVARTGTLNILLRTDPCIAGRTRFNGARGSISLRVSDVWFTPARPSIWYQSRQSATLDAGLTSRGNIPEAAYNDSESRAQKVSVFVARSGAESTQSHLVDGHHLHRFEPRIRVLNGNHRLVQLKDFVVATLEYNGRWFLR